MIRAIDKKRQNLVEETLLANYDSYYRMAYSYVHNEHDALDIVQSGCITAIEKSHTLREEQYVRTWVYRIMVNATFKRANELNKVLPLNPEQENGAGTTDKYTDIDLERAMDRLPNRDKLIVQLRFFEDMGIREIAGILEMNQSTVKSILYRALDKLHLDLKD